MYKIYINERPLILVSSEDLNLIDNKIPNSLINHHSGNPKHLVNYLDMMEKGQHHGQVVLFNDNVKDLYNAFKKLYKPIRAAGGLVENEKGEHLWIFRRKKWDLPKGKIEKGEKKRAAAVREVMEETGISNVKIGDKICKTYHTYKSKKTRLLKITHWYKMTSLDQKLIPQKEEDIDSAEWIHQSKSNKYLPKSYVNIQEVFDHLK